MLVMYNTVRLNCRRKGDIIVDYKSNEISGISVGKAVFEIRGKPKPAICITFWNGETATFNANEWTIEFL